MFQEVIQREMMRLEERVPVYIVKTQLMSLQGLAGHGEAGGTVEGGTDKAQAQEQV